MAGIITTSNIPSTLKPTLDLIFGNDQKKTKYWMDLGFKVSNSSDAYEDDQEFAGTGIAPPKVQGAMLAIDTVQQGFAKRYMHVTSGLRLIVSEEALDDCKYDEAIKGTENLSTSLSLTQEYESASVFVNSFSSSYVGADALSLCNTAHLLPKGGTFSNMLSTAMSLSETAIETMCANMTQLPASNGYIVNGYQPKRIVVPPQLWFRANRILKSTQQNDTNNNAINVLKGMGIQIADQGNPYLTSTTNWWLVSDLKAGLRFIWRKKPMFRQHNTEDNYTATFSGVQRFSVGWTDPRDVYGSNI
ncbi:MAG TPA: hypothetical protein VFL67_20015 [Mycobacterium sp.]|nr:hypothetical protein [Mycobacterium sp.]